MSETTHPAIKGPVFPECRQYRHAYNFVSSAFANLYLDGWFREIGPLWPGQAMTLKVKQVLHHEKSKYQDILFFESTDHGTVFVLDDAIQLTEKDEFA